MQQNTQPNSKKTIIQIKNSLCNISKKSTVLLVFFALALVLYFIIFISKGFYHSDCSDTILWAQAMLDGKSIINPDFQYAALLPFGGQLIIAPFVAIFGYGMKAQLMGMVAFTLLFTFALVYFCKSANLNYRWISVTTAFVLLTLCSSEKLREIFWCHIIYYSLGVFFLLLGLGLVFNIIKKDKFPITLYIVLIIWTVLCSINGSQSLTLYTLPVMGALIAERFFDTETPFFSRKNARYGLIIIGFIVAIVIGLFLSKIIIGDVTAVYQDAYSKFDKSDNWTNNLLKLLPAILTLCGASPVSNTPIFSFDGILILLRIICIAIVMITPFIMLAMYKKITDKFYRLTLLCHLMLTGLLLLGWIFGLLHAANWRLSPLVVTSSILTIMFIKWILKEGKNIRYSALLLIPVSIMFMLFTLDISKAEETHQTNANLKLQAVSEYLQNSNLEYGYATFWNSNAITLFTDSEVKLRSIKQNNGKLEVMLYQTNINWYNDNSYTEYFLLLSKSEYSLYLTSDSYKNPIDTRLFEDYVILIYDYNIMKLK